jgi:hypothetical protein
LSGSFHADISVARFEARTFLSVAADIPTIRTGFDERLRPAAPTQLSDLMALHTFVSLITPVQSDVAGPAFADKLPGTKRFGGATGSSPRGLPLAQEGSTAS